MNTNKIILITGGTGKIGNILVKHFSLAGHQVVFTSRNAEKISLLEDNLKKINPATFVKGILLDHTKSNSTQELLDQLKVQLLFPSVLINNVRNIDFLKNKLGNKFPHEDDWIGEFKLAVIIPSEITMKLAEQSASTLSNVINISSIYGLTPPNFNLYPAEEEMVPLHYGVAKAAQIHLTKELAVRLAKNNVRANSVTFGGVEGRVDHDFIARYAKLCPQGRMLRDEDIIGPVEFLLSEASSGMTGHNLIVDGGWTVW